MGNPVILLSVGTSLLSNGGGIRAGGGGYVKEYVTAVQAPKGVLARPANQLTDQQINQTVGQLSNALKRHVLPNLQQELAHRSNPASKALDLLPQELSYLALLARQDEEAAAGNATVILLASDTPKGTACARVIEKAIQECMAFDCFTGDVRVEVVEGLTLEDADADNSDAFSHAGVPNLIRIMREHGTEAGEGGRVIMNFTGGFKGAIPYTTLAALFLDCPNVELHYLFGETDKIVVLPVYPIGLDFNTWHREAALLEAGRQLPETYRGALSPRMHAVARELARTETGLPQLLHEKYEEQLGTDPLQQYSKRVIHQFLDKGKYADWLNAVVDTAGPHIWLGDKLPMAADHAARHHHNLLELAQVFLTPIMDCQHNNRKFLTEEERLVLLGALLLHDCGHTIDRLPLDNGQEVPLTRSEIRNLHHFLAYYRLTKGIKPDLGWQHSNDDDVRALVPWLCVYHRRSTGWTTNKQEYGKGKCPFLDMTIGPPCEPLNPLRSLLQKYENEVDFPKLVALLRLIDGCDNQNRRVGKQSYRDMYEQMLTYDGQTFRLQLASLAPLAPRLEDTRVNGFLDEVRDWSPEEKDLPQITRDVLAYRYETAKKVDFEHALFRQLLALVDECAVRDRQTLHFAKHEAVQRVFILPDSGFKPDGPWNFLVRIVPNPAMLDDVLDSGDFFAAHREAAGGTKQTTLRGWIGEEISSEIRAEEDTGKNTSAMLQHLAGVSGVIWQVSFQWDDKDVPFQQYTSENG